MTERRPFPQAAPLTCTHRAYPLAPKAMAHAPTHGNAASTDLELPPFEGIDARLMDELGTFELFFKTFGFKRVHGRLWGFLVLAGQPLSSKDISEHLSLSAGATSTTLNELAEWGAITSEFDSHRRCNLHSPVGNTLSIVATVFRRREQVVFGKFKTSSQKTLAYVRQRYGEKDSRVLALRSIISTCEIAEAMMTLIFTTVERALGDSQSLLTKAVNAALKVGVAMPARLFGETLLRATGEGIGEGIGDSEGEDPAFASEGENGGGVEAADGPAPATGREKRYGT